MNHVRPGHEWDRFEGLTLQPDALQGFLDKVPFAQRKPQKRAPQIEVPAELTVPIQPVMSTQAGFGNLLNEIGKAKSRLRRHASSPPRRMSRSRPISAPG